MCCSNRFNQTWDALALYFPRVTQLTWFMETKIEEGIEVSHKYTVFTERFMDLVASGYRPSREVPR